MSRASNCPPTASATSCMISAENMTIGTSEHRHDLAALNEPLRSHGGLTEQEVPFIVNRKIDLPNARTCAISMRSSTPPPRPRIRSDGDVDQDCPIELRHEAMRIGGERSTRTDVIEVRYPYTDEVIGTVPAGRPSMRARRSRSRRTTGRP